VDIKTTLKASVAASALFAVIAPVSAVITPDIAHAGNISDGGSNKLTMSGRLVRGLMYADSGPQNEWFAGDGGSAGSRVNWLFTGDLNENTAVRGFIRINLPHSDDLSNASLTQSGEVIVDNAFGNVGNAEVRFSHKAMGSLELGLGSMASNGRSETDYSGVGPAFAASAVGSASGIPFFDEGTALTYGQTVGSVFSAFDGLGSLERIRYNLPSINGLNLAVATAPGSTVWDVGGSYTAKVGDSTAMVQAQVNNTPTAASDGGWSMSAGVDHPSGASIQGYYGTTDNNTAAESDPEGYGISVGYKAKLIAAGTTNFAVGYLNSQDVGTQGNDAEAWMVGAKQGFGSGVSAHISYRNIALDTSTVGTSFDDITSFFLGTIVTF
jgi:hypothetical protein